MACLSVEIKLVETKEEWWTLDAIFCGSQERGRNTQSSPIASIAGSDRSESSLVRRITPHERRAKQACFAEGVDETFCN